MRSFNSVDDASSLVSNTVTSLVETVFTEEDKRNLKIIADELPKLRSVVEELMETLEVLSDEKLMKSIKASLKDIREGRVLSYKELLAELHLDEKQM